MLCLRRCRLTAVILFAFAIAAIAQEDLNQHLHDQYQGKTFVLRNFYSGDHLRYNASGMPDDAAAGDWTTDGFVQIQKIQFSGDRLIIKGRRMVAGREANEFKLYPRERLKPGNRQTEEVRVEIDADPGMHNPAPEQVDDLIAKIFLTSQDSLAGVVPDYWKACVSGGLKGTDKDCLFAQELLVIPGVSASGDNDDPGSAKTVGSPGTASSRFHVGGSVSPPRVVYQREPEFTDAARAAKFQGTVLLMFVLDKDGTPTHISISRPLGYGLDEKAVQALQSWKFKPSEKDGVPVAVEIAVELEFHLY